MRATFFIALFLVTAIVTATAGETLPVLKVGNDVYSNVVITAVTPTDIFFTSAQGMGNVKLKKLDPELQKHFHYNETNAAAVEKEQIVANAEYRAQQAVARPAPRPPSTANDVRETVDKNGNTIINVPLVHASELSWGTDLDQALAQARAEGKMVLIDFTSSDSSTWSVKFDQDILSTDMFASYASAKMVLMKLDFPKQTPQNGALKQSNREIAHQYSVTSFPTFVVLNSRGNEIGRQIGYMEGGPQAFITELEKFNK